MARARSIKPGLYKNEELIQCSVWARYIFPGLWMLADREGRLEDRPIRIKIELLPADSQDVDQLLDELQARGFLVRYQNSDGKFIQISKFLTHQNPHYSEKPSTIKPPELPEKAAIIKSDSGKHPAMNGHPLPENSGELPEKAARKRGSQPPSSLTPSSLTPSSLSPDSGKEQEARASRFALLQIPPEWSQFCRQERPDLDPARTFERFADYWRAKPGADGRKLDWLATWRNWVRDEKSQQRKPGTLGTAGAQAANVIQGWLEKGA
jgi:hypothetical protein